MKWQKGGMVDDGALLCSIDHFHGNELGAVWEDIERGTNTTVLVQHLWDHLA